MQSLLRRADIRQTMIAAFAVLVLVIQTPCGALAVQTEEFAQPSRQSQRISQVVAALMEREHLSEHPLDDEISKRALAIYLKNLDPLKMYFLKSDIEEFNSRFATKLDDMMPNGDYTAAFEIYDRFLKRVDEQVVVANQLIEAEHDYSIHEELVTDPDLIDYSNTKEELNELWRKRIKYNLLVFGTDDEKDNPDKKDPRERLRNRYRAFANRMHQFDNEDVIELYVSAITTSYDPHTSYMSKSTFVNFMISMSLELDGIGATLQSTDDGLTVIRRIVPGGAADKSGEIVVDDKIIAVGRGPMANWSIFSI